MTLYEWCMETLNERILQEWHPIKNGDLKPSDVAFKSHRKVWWKCEEGHEWESVISSRSNGCNCPYCSGQKVLKGYNDLETLFPSISAEWHPTKNVDLKPSDFRGKSNKKAWWKCVMCGHEWEARISKRTDGQGCPECAKEWRISFPEKSIVYYLKKIGLIFEENFHAKWLEEFDLDVYFSDLNVGISYDGPLHQDSDKESRKNDLCKKNGTFLIRICDSRCVEIGEFYGVCIRRYDNKDTSLNEVILELLNTLKRLYQIDIPESLSIDVSRDRIGIYELMKMHRKKNSIASQYPDLMEEWNYEKNGSLNPEYLLPGSEKKVWWKCEKGHEWQAIVNSRSRGTNCPICSNNQVLKGYNDLATLRPEVAKEWHPNKNFGITATDVTKSSGQKVWWLCGKCKYEWQAAVYSRTSNNPNGCPRCGKDKYISSLRSPKQGNSLTDRNPMLAAEWHPTKNGELLPDNISYKSHLKVWWKCKKGHEWQAVMSSRAVGNGCPLCYQERRKHGGKSAW